MKNYLFVLMFTTLMVARLSAQFQFGARDENGRHIIPRGFVNNTNDAVGELFYTSDDYLRMVRMGANYQVVRLELGKLSTFFGRELNPDYLLKLDTMVKLGKEYGMKTVFKMTVYGAGKFDWESFWLNNNAELEEYISAWKVIWERYQDEEAVVGYDLVNEPRKNEMLISYNKLTENYLVPTYQQIIDAYRQVDDGKALYCQAIFMNKGDKVDNNQYAEITRAIDRENVVFTPHIYQHKKEWILPTMKRFVREAALQNGPMLVGEWGFPTFLTTDYSVEDQMNYMDFYIHTVNIFDSLGVGTIKAWFSGNRKMQDFMPGGPSTWAIFSDSVGIGTVERKYITDIIARPYPQAIAGDINSFKYDFATRILSIELLTDNNKGFSELFIGANRHYPDGFTVRVGSDLILIHDPLKNTGLEIVKNVHGFDVSNFIWDEVNQQLMILKWPENNKNLKVSIEPGLRG